MKLNGKAYGVAFGVLWMFVVVWATVLAMIGKGTGPFNVINTLYFGWFSPTLLGIVIGIVVSFIDGLIAGYIFAALYNWLSK